MQASTIIIPAVTREELVTVRKTVVVEPESASLQLTLTPREAQFIASILAHRNAYVNGHASSDGDNFTHISSDLYCATRDFANVHVGRAEMCESSLWHSEARRARRYSDPGNTEDRNTTDCG